MKPVAVAAFAVVACSVAAGAVAGGDFAAGSRPPPGSLFEGRFSGTGSAYASVYIDSGPLGTAIRAMSGALPARCVLDGKVKLPGRDGAIAIDFNLWDRGTRTGSSFIKPGGAFSLRFHHRADVAKSTTYTVWIRGTFSRTSVRGRVKGVSNDDFFGSCKGDRAYTARLKRS